VEARTKPMLDPKKIEKLRKDISNANTRGMKNPHGWRSWSKVKNKCLQAQLAKLDLVSREELMFKAQVLIRTREMEAMEARMRALESDKQ